MWKEVVKLSALMWYLVHKGFWGDLEFYEPDEFWLTAKTKKDGYVFDFQIAIGPEYGMYMVLGAEVFKDGKEVYSQVIAYEVSHDKEEVYEWLMEYVEDVVNELKNKLDN